LGDAALTRGRLLVPKPIPEFRIAVLQESGAFVRGSSPTVSLLFLSD